MKPTNSTAARWRKTGLLLCAIGALGSASGICWIGILIVEYFRPALEIVHPQTRLDIGAPHPSPRPELITQIASRRIRPETTIASRSATQPLELTKTSTPPATVPPVEVIGTATSVSGEPQAFVRVGSTKSVVAWMVGSVNGPYHVTEIGDGSVVLNGAGEQYVLHVDRKAR
jgi:hypothetical protein